MKKYYPKKNNGEAEAQPARNRIEPNQFIAKRYLTKFEIRRDAMIHVLMAFDREKDMNVSLMPIPPQLIKNPNLLADLKVELSAASKLNHNNITRLYSIDTWNQVTFAVMEYVPGYTLAAHLEENQGKLSLDESLALLRQIANGLDFAHTRPTPLPHLGLKPQNILLTEDRLVKIADFGLANILSSPVAKIPGRETPETVAYRAPEQITGGEVGPKTDIYALAAIAYEMLSGKKPVDGDDLRAQIINQEIEPIEGLPDHVNDALLLALSKDPQNRPASAGDFIAMLAGEKPVPKFSATSPDKNRKKMPAFLIASLLVIVLLLAGLGIFLSRQPEDKTVTMPIQPAPIPKKIIAKTNPVPRPDPISQTVPEPAKAESPKKSAKIAVYGNVSIASAPEGADIYINDIRKGKTPLVLHDLTAGEYEISIRKDGFETHTEPLVVNGSATTEVTAILTQNYGALQIESDPPGAEVYIDGRKSGVTPVTLARIENGDHTVKVVRSGYDTWTNQVSIAAGRQSTIQARLSVSMGNLVITSTPADAVIYLSGVKHGKTPLELKVEQGVRTIEIRKPGYDTWKQDVKINAGDHLEVKAELSQLKGGLQVESSPSDANVYISGKFIGKTPLHLKDVQSGNATVEVRKDCFQKDSRTISVKPGKLAKLDFSLTPDCGTIIITSEPEKAKWYIDNRFAGTTPGKVENLSSGAHRIRITKDQFIDWETTDTVTAGKTKTITAQLRPVLPDAGATWREPITGMEFVWIQNGCYSMGSSLNELGRNEDEGPVHEVCLDGFWIGRYEVTQGQWEKIRGSNPSFFNRKSDYPVDNVSWKDVQSFIQEFSAKSSGRFQFRLPSEAEWEYACRSAGQPERFAGGDRSNTLAWFKGNSNRTSHSVGEKAANNVGLYDMSGNLSEWVQDTYDAGGYKFHGKKNPVIDKSGTNHVIRGGNWNQDENSCRSAARDYAPADEQSKTIGFRLVRRR